MWRPWQSSLLLVELVQLCAWQAIDSLPTKAKKDVTRRGDLYVLIKSDRVLLVAHLVCH